MNKRSRTFFCLAVGLACTVVEPGIVPVGAAEVIDHSFPQPSAASATAEQSQPAPQQAAQVGAETQQQTVQAQPGTLEERVTRMEHMLDSGTLVDMYSQLNDLQQELQTMRGELEVQRHDLDELQKHQRELYLDEDRRLRALEVGGGGKVSSNGNTPPSLPNAAPQLPNATPQLPNATPQLPNATPQLPSAAPSAPGGNPQQQVPAFNPSAAAPVAGSATPQVRADYDRAFNLLRAAQYDKAIDAFQHFLQENPDSPLSDNAQYWLGEADYVTRRFPAALEEFQKVVSKYPDSSKVPDAKLKIGFTHYELSQWNDARKALNEVIAQYPDTSAAKLAQNRLQKMKAEGH